MALITLACPTHGVAATFKDVPGFAVHAPSGLLDQRRAAGLLAALGLPARGQITLVPDFPPGGGAGMSTAALVALARAAGACEDRIAAACLAVEGAVDPLMLAAPDAVLWAPRAAQVLRPLPPPPRAEIVGGFRGTPEWTDPADTRFPDVDDLIAEWARAPGLAMVARLASLSAARTTALRGPANEPTPALAARLGAAGWARAHTGTARALIFPPGKVPEGAEEAMRAAGYTDVLRFATGERA